ncbi:MAG: serine/threonine-protein kinase [Planctomycetota bacterium]
MDEKSLFLQALAKPAGDQRIQWLQQACGSNHDLLDRLLRLLSHHEKSGDFLESPAIGSLHSVESESTSNSRDRPETEASEFLGMTLADSGLRDASVMPAIGATLHEMPRVSLRISAEEGSDPIASPDSDELPQVQPESRYRLDGEIARGGMGAIIKARDTDLGRDLAIKILLDAHRQKPEVVQRFVEEAQIGGQLQHPGIAPIYELGRFADNRPFFSMKLVKGKTLARLLADRKHTAENLSAFLGHFAQVCQTVAYAHSRGVIHRDLKPANIMIGAFGEVQVMDWGLAKVLLRGGIADERYAKSEAAGGGTIKTLRSGVGAESMDASSSVASQTRLGSVMGTPAYMPPEQALGKNYDVDERSDVFGLGAILCEILTGKPPYAATDSTKSYELACSCQLEECFRRLADCTADTELISLAEQCLKENRKERPRDAKCLANAIEDYEAGIQHRLQHATVEKAQAEVKAAEEKHRRRLALRWTLAVMLLLLSGIGIVSYSLFQEGAARREAERVTELAKLAASREKIAATDARKAQAEADFRLTRLYTAAGSKSMERNKASEALLWWATAWDSDKDKQNEEGHRSRLAAAFESMPRLAGICFHPESVYDLDINPQGTRLVTHSQGKHAFVWDIAASRLTTRPLTHSADVTSVEFSQDGSLILTGSEDGKATLWDANTGEIQKAFSHEEPVVAAQFSAFGKRVAVAAGTKLYRWNVETRESIGSPMDCGSKIWYLQASQLHDLVVTASTDSTANVWSLDSGTNVSGPWPQRVPVGDQFVFYKAGPSLSPNGKTLVTFLPSSDKKTSAVAIRIDGENQERVSETGASMLCSPQWSQDGNSFFIAGRDGTQQIQVEVSTGKVLSVLQHPRETAFVAVGKSNAYCSISGGGIQRWDIEQSLPIGQRIQMCDFVKQLRLSSDGKWLIASSDDGTARVWDLRPSEQIVPYSYSSGASNRAVYEDGSSYDPKAIARSQARSREDCCTTEGRGKTKCFRMTTPLPQVVSRRTENASRR